MPEKVNSFLNYFWVNLPAKWKIDHTYINEILSIKITVGETEEEERFITKNYSSEMIHKINADADEIASLCVKKIIKEIKNDKK